MSDEARIGRKYQTTTLPTLREGYSIQQNKATLLKLYSQVCSTWKQLVGVRFKLLGFVPGVSIILLGAVLSNKREESLPGNARLLICSLGLLITFGLFIYDWRNSELHDDLISRGRKIEEELGVDTCIFRGRKESTGFYKHDVATGIIYGSTLLAWAVAIAGILCRKW